MKINLMFIMFVSVILLTVNCPVLAQSYVETVNKIAKQIAAGLVKKNKKAFTIEDFTNEKGEVVELGRLMALDIETELLSPDYSFTVVTRKDLDKILNEQKLSRSDLYPSESGLRKPL